MVTPCVDVVSGVDYGTLAFTNMFACDKWAVPHIVAPLLVTIMTRNVYFGFTIAGIAEIVEYLIFVIFGSFVIFVSNGEISETDRVENIVGVLLEDWLIQGGIGALILGCIFIKVIPGKPFVRWADAWDKNKRGSFWFYLVIGILMLGSIAIYPLELGSLRFGILIYPVILFVFIIVIWLREGEHFYAEFWLTFLAFATAINVSNLFDYLYSGPIQSWLISLVFLFYLFVRFVARFLIGTFTKPFHRL